MGDNVKVVIRIRPLNEKEQHEGSRRCLEAQVERSAIIIEAKPKPKTFTYDFVADEDISQDEIFQVVGKPITTSCLSGYNGSVFAYGQTGSGKTHTIIGPDNCSEDSPRFDERGLLPRCIEFLFASINREERRCEGLNFQVKCSFIEIYQEQVLDLLAQTSTSLAIREDLKKGVYVENLVESCVTSVNEAFAFMRQGNQHRHTGSTSMNKESSRSHSVFTLLIESRETKKGLLNFRSSRFHLIDLAGSERQKSTEAAGARLKEAGMINKSLAALGSVINALVDISEGKSRHVHYRDSKLTFLLKDSLGGNSKTCIVAAVSPSATSFGETLSTLKFAQRAKQIRNKAIVNEDLSGNIELLKEQVRLLKEQLKGQGSRPTDYSLVTMNTRIGELESLLEVNLKLRQEVEVALQNEIGGKEEQISKLSDALNKFEKKAANDKMVLKFRDAAISRLQKDLPEETSNLHEEIRLLRECVDMPPIAAKLLAENEQLKSYIENLERELRVDPFALCFRLKENQEFTSKLASSLQESAIERAQLRALLEELTGYKSGDIVASPVKRRYEEELARLRALTGNSDIELSREDEMMLTDEVQFHDRIESLEKENSRLSCLLEENSFRLNKSQNELEASFSESLNCSSSVRALKQALKDAARASRLETELEECRQDLESKELQVSELYEQLEILTDAHEYLKDQYKQSRPTPSVTPAPFALSAPFDPNPTLSASTQDIEQLIKDLQAKEESEANLKLTIRELEELLSKNGPYSSRSSNEELEYYKQEHETLLGEIDTCKAQNSSLKKSCAEMEKLLSEAAVRERGNKAEMEKLAVDIDLETKKLTKELTDAYEALLKVKNESETTIAHYKLECDALKTLADEAEEERLAAVEHLEAIQKTQKRELELVRVKLAKELEQHQTKATEGQMQVEMNLRNQVTKLTERLTLMTQNETSYIETQKKLDIMKRQLDQSKTETAQLKAELANAQELALKVKDGRRHDGDLNRPASIGKASLLSQLEDRNGALSDLHAKHQDCMARLETLTEENKRLRLQTSHFEGDVTEIKTKFIESLSNREDFLKQLNLLRESEYQIAIENAELKAKFESSSIRNSQLQNEINALNAENEQLGGHSNMSQKIKLHAKLKDENNKLKSTNYKLTDELRRTKMKLDAIHKRFQEIVKREGGQGELGVAEDHPIKDDASAELVRIKRGVAKIAEISGVRVLDVGSFDDTIERVVSSLQALRYQASASSHELSTKDREIISLNKQLKLLSKEVVLQSYKADLENRSPLVNKL